MSATRVVLPRLAEFGSDPDTEPSSQQHFQRLHPGSSSVTPTLIKRVTRCQIKRPTKMVSESITSLTKTNSMLDLALSGIPHEKNLHLPKIEEDALKQTDSGQLAPSPLPHLLRSKHRITTSSLFPEPSPLIPAKSGSRLNLDLAIEGQDMRLPPPRTPTESRKTEKPRLLTTPLKIRSSSDDLPKGVISFEENIRKLLNCQSLGVPIESKYQASGSIATPVFHCPRCLKHWAMYNVTPHGCKQTAKPTKGPSFYITNTGNRILKTFQAMPKDHQYKFLDKISSIVPDAKGIIHVPSVEYLSIAMGKTSSETLHGKRAELVAKNSVDQAAVSPSVSVIGGWDTTGSDSNIVTPSRVFNRIGEPEPAFLRIHERPVASALVTATAVKRDKVNEINKVTSDDRPSTSIGQTSYISDQTILAINDDNNSPKPQPVSYESRKDTTAPTSRVSAHRPEITETTGQFAPDGTYYTGIYTHDGQFIPNGRISPNSRRKSGLLGPDGRFYVDAYYDQDGRFYGRESQAYSIGFTFLNAAQVPAQNNLQNNDYVIIEKPQSHSHIGRSFENYEKSAYLNNPVCAVRSCGSGQPDKTADCHIVVKRREQTAKTKSKENDRAGHTNSETSAAEINPQFQNTGLVSVAESNILVNGFNTPERSSHNQMKNEDNVERVTNSMDKENNNPPLSKETGSEKQHDHLHNDFIQETVISTIGDKLLNIKDDSISTFGGKERYTYSDESFESLFADDSIADDDLEVGVVRNRPEGQGSIVENETEHLSKGKTDNGLNPRPKQRRESTFNYMGVKDKAVTTDSQESLSNSQNKAKESKKRVIKNKAVKNVTGKPDTKPGSLQKHMFATPEESLAKASAVLGATSKRKGTKLNQLVNSSNTMVSGKAPVMPVRSRDDFPTNLPSGAIRSVTKLPSTSESFKEPSKKYTVFKSESGVTISDNVLNERTISSADETKRGKLPVLPGISTNHSVNNEDEIPRRKPREIIKKVAKNKRKTVGEIKTTSETTENQSKEINELKLVDLDNEPTEIKPRISNQQLEKTQSSDINIMFQSDLLPKLLQDNTNTTSHRMTYSTLPSTFGKFPKPLTLATPSSQKISSTGDSAIYTDAPKYELTDVASNVEDYKQAAVEVPLKSPTQKVKGYVSATPTSSNTLSVTSSQESIFESVSQIWRRHDDELIRLRELENNGGISILNFTPAFRFSLFDIPYQYVEHNNKLVERANKLRHLRQPKKSKRKVVKKPKLLTETEALKI